MTTHDGEDTLGRLRELFIESVDLPPDERRAFLATLAERDPATAKKLAALIEADAQLTQTPTQPLLPQLAVLRQAAMPRIGARIGAWTLKRELGAGGMGTVYLGESADAAQPRVAIKVLNADVVDTPARRRFLLERDVLARLSHPLIARFVDAGEHEGALYAAMEYVDGTPILHYADRKRLSVRDRVGLFLRVCAAVSHAHAHRIVHRDIKSGNVLVTADGLPKLLDFGIAKPLRVTFGAHRVERTATAQRWFTPHSAAPEQITGEGIGVGTDVYGLGVLLYELLCGEPPFELTGMTAGQIENTITGLDPEPPSQRALEGIANVDDARARLRGLTDRGSLAEALYGELDGIVLMALRKNPEDRYASVDEFAADLRNVLRARPTEAGRARRFYTRMFDLARRHRAVVALGVVTLAVAALTALSLRGSASPPPAAPTPATASPAPALAATTRDVAVDPQAQLAWAIADLERNAAAAALARVDAALAAIVPDDANIDLRVRLYDTKAAALLRLADIGAARGAIDAGLGVAVTRRQRAQLEWRRIEVLDARGRSDEALAAARELADGVLPLLPADDALAQRIRARAGVATSAASASAATADCPAALAGDIGNDANPQTLQRLAQCAGMVDGGDPATQFALKVAHGRLLNRIGDYAGAARVLDEALEGANADPALRRLDTHRVASLAAALAHYGADASSANHDRLRHALDDAGWLSGDDGRAQWREQSALAEKLGFGVSAER